MPFESMLDSVGFLLARVLFGTVLGYLALGNLLALDESIAYAESKGAPFPRFGVPFGSLLLLAGSISIVVGAFPLVGALSVIAFLVGITPIMHDFWALDGRDAQNERIHFLKNAGLVSVALVFLLVADQPWPYAFGIGL